jgi:hypothetical protein
MMVGAHLAFVPLMGNTRRSALYHRCFSETNPAHLPVRFQVWKLTVCLSLGHRGQHFWMSGARFATTSRGSAGIKQGLRSRDLQI